MKTIVIMIAFFIMPEMIWKSAMPYVQQIANGLPGRMEEAGADLRKPADLQRKTDWNWLAIRMKKGSSKSPYKAGKIILR